MNRVNIVALIVALIIALIVASVLISSMFVRNRRNQQLSASGQANFSEEGVYYVPPLSSNIFFRVYHIVYIYTTNGYRVLSDGRLSKSSLYEYHLTDEELKLGCVVYVTKQDYTNVTIISRNGENRSIQRNNGTMTLTKQDEFLIVPPDMKFIATDIYMTEYHYTPGIYNRFYDTMDMRQLQGAYAESSASTFTDTILVIPKRQYASNRQVIKASGSDSSGRMFWNREFIRGVYPDTRINLNFNRMTIWHTTTKDETRIFSTEPCFRCEPCRPCKPTKPKKSKKTKTSKRLYKSRDVANGAVNESDNESDNGPPTIVTGTIYGSKAMLTLPTGYYPYIYITGPLEIQTTNNNSILLKTANVTYTYPEQSIIIASTNMDIRGISIGTSLPCSKCFACKPCS